AHVQLARRRALRRSVRATVDHHRARAADAFATVVVERDRFAAVGDQSLVDDVEHLEERHLGRDVGGVDLLERTLGVGARLAPDVGVESHGVHGPSEIPWDYLYLRGAGWPSSTSSVSLWGVGGGPPPWTPHAATCEKCSSPRRASPSSVWCSTRR